MVRGVPLSLIINEFIRARVYAGSVRMENLHGKGETAGRGLVDRGIRRLGRISVSFCALARVALVPFPALSTATLRYHRRKRRNSLAVACRRPVFRSRSSVIGIGTAIYWNI